MHSKHSATSRVENPSFHTLTALSAQTKPNKGYFGANNFNNKKEGKPFNFGSFVSHPINCPWGQTETKTNAPGPVL